LHRHSTFCKLKKNVHDLSAADHHHLETETAEQAGCKYCPGNAYPMPNISDIIQRVGESKFISLFDIKAVYHNTAVHPDHQWLTAFVWDGGLYEYTRAPFG